MIPPEGVLSYVRERTKMQLSSRWTGPLGSLDAAIDKAFSLGYYSINGVIWRIKMDEKRKER